MRITLAIIIIHCQGMMVMAHDRQPPADLMKLERQILKEPKYRTKVPRYCLMVFGIEATAKVWMVQDGDVLFVDTNGNGDLTQPGKWFKKKDGVFLVPYIKVDGLTHANLIVFDRPASKETPNIGSDWNRIRQSDPKPRIWNVSIKTERSPKDLRDLPRHIEYLVNGDSRGMLLFGKSVKDAPIIHFDGPYSLSLQDPNQTLSIGLRSKLQIGVGCHGVGPGTFSFILYENVIPAKSFPVVEIAYPTKPGELAFKRKYELKHLC
jgi:hypothetical protein